MKAFLIFLILSLMWVASANAEDKPFHVDNVYVTLTGVIPAKDIPFWGRVVDKKGKPFAETAQWEKHTLVHLQILEFGINEEEEEMCRVVMTLQILEE